MNTSRSLVKDKRVQQLIRQITIHTRRMLSGSLVGDFTTAQKGSGFEFNQIREYQAGDDIRFIDWNSTARTGKFLVRQYLEERNRTVVIMLDVSSSCFFASGSKRKFDVMAEVAGILSLVADYGKDAVGLMLFSNEVHTYIQPARGRSHMYKIMEAALTAQPCKGVTSLKAPLELCAQLSNKNMLGILISDFIDDTSYDMQLRIANKKADVMAIRCLDTLERHGIAARGIRMNDSEYATKDMVHADTAYFLQDRLRKQNAQFKKCGIDVLDITSNAFNVRELVTFFRRRMQY